MGLVRVGQLGRKDTPARIAARPGFELAASGHAVETGDGYYVEIVVPRAASSADADQIEGGAQQ